MEVKRGQEQEEEQRNSIISLEELFNKDGDIKELMTEYDELDNKYKKFESARKALPDDKDYGSKYKQLREELWSDTDAIRHLELKALIRLRKHNLIGLDPENLEKIKSELNYNKLQRNIHTYYCCD